MVQKGSEYYSRSYSNLETNARLGQLLLLQQDSSFRTQPEFLQMIYANLSPYLKFELIRAAKSLSNFTFSLPPAPNEKLF